MKRIENKPVKVHAFVCENNREDGKACCNAVGGHELYAKLKSRLKEEGIYSTHKVTRTGCLGHCNPVGCTVVIYREGRPPLWSTENVPEDFDKIWREIVET